MAKRKSLEKKLAAAVSVVNLLNAAAPIALPYVNVARNVSTAGGTRSRWPIASPVPSTARRRRRRANK